MVRCSPCASPYKDSTEVPWIIQSDPNEESEGGSESDPSFVEDAKFILRHKPHPVRTIDPKVLLKYPVPEEQGGWHPSGKNWLLARDIRKADTRIPIILAQEDGRVVAWDGGHRIAKALRESHARISYVLLTAGESKKAWGYGGKFIPDATPQFIMPLADLERLSDPKGTC